MDAEERFEDLVGAFSDTDGVTPPSGGSGFGRSALRYNRKIFAMFVRGQLVVKLPAARVIELIDEGYGAHFDANKGTPMKEWLALAPESKLDWEQLANEALTYARAASASAASTGAASTGAASTRAASARAPTNRTASTRTASTRGPHKL